MTSEAHLARLFNIGSLCVDHIYRVPSLVIAGQTIACSSERLVPGGKGLNQSIAAAQAGASVCHFGAVGGDGDMLVDVLQRFCGDAGSVLRLDGQSGQAVIQVDDQGQNAIVISAGANRRLPEDLLSAAVAAMAPDDWLLLQNETNGVAEVIRMAKAKQLSVAVNLAPFDASCLDLPLELVDLLIVNEAEAAGLAGLPVPTESTATTVAASAAHANDLAAKEQAIFAALVAKLPKVCLIMTLGARGALSQSPGDPELMRHAAISVEAVDETAAGDTFVGFLMAELLIGTGMLAAIELASVAGALAVTRSGAAESIPSRAEVVAEIARRGV